MGPPPDIIPALIALFFIAIGLAIMIGVVIGWWLA